MRFIDIKTDGGRCRDNARSEAMWARMKEELLYGRYDTKKMSIEQLKTLIWRYFIVYWNTRRICSANGDLPPLLKRKLYYDSLAQELKGFVKKKCKVILTISF